MNLNAKFYTLIDFQFIIQRCYNIFKIWIFGITQKTTHNIFELQPIIQDSISCLPNISSHIFASNHLVKISHRSSKQWPLLFRLLTNCFIMFNLIRSGNTNTILGSTKFFVVYSSISRGVHCNLFIIDVVLYYHTQKHGDSLYTRNVDLITSILFPDLYKTFNWI